MAAVVLGAALAGKVVDAGGAVDVSGWHFGNGVFQATQKMGFSSTTVAL
jgi:hypothetical protein